jgi:hypothetical protein
MKLTKKSLDALQIVRDQLNEGQGTFICLEYDVVAKKLGISRDECSDVQSALVCNLMNTCRGETSMLGYITALFKSGTINIDYVEDVHNISRMARIAWLDKILEFGEISLM